MSRIEEALRLARDQRSTPGGNGTTRSEAFSSPWELAQSSASVGLEEPPVSRPLPIGSPTLAPATVTVDGLNAKWKTRLATSPDADWLLVEQYRRLAATLHQAQLDAGTRTVMVTSASPGDGKTMTAINLALTLSGSYRRRVLLIDADLRRPSISDISHMSNALGLSEGLRAKSDQQLTVLRVTDRLTILPAGRPDPDPMGNLTSARMRRILEDAAQQFDWVILDAPPVGGIADTSLLVNMVDGALLVIRAGQTKCPLVKKSIEALGRDRVLGVVLNGVEPSGQDAEYGYYRQYQPEEPKRR